jgi:mRNA interferase RelE/StbE
MKYTLYVTRSAEDDLARLGKSVASRIVDKLEFFASTDSPLAFAKKLKDSTCGSYRFRIGDYRAIFDIDTKGRVLVLMILRIKHRREVYR